MRAALGHSLAGKVLPWRRDSIAQLRSEIAEAETVEIDAVHHLFLHKPAETEAAMEAFLSKHRIR